MRLAALLGTVALVACGAPPPDEPAASNNVALAPEEASASNAARTDDGDAEAVPLNGNGAETAPQTLAEIPTGFRGRWDASRDACARPASEMRLVVSANSLRFYESVGQVLAVRPQDEEAVAIDLRTTGEGETRTETRTLSMTSDGRLSVESGGTMATRVRCQD